MRSAVFVTVTLGVIVAGVYFGKRDFEEDLALRRAAAPRAAPVETPVRRDEPERPAAEETVRRAVEEVPAAPVPTDEEIAAAIRRLEARLLETGLEGAGKEAAMELEELISRNREALRRNPDLVDVLAPLRRWELKARLFHLLVDPIDRDDLPEVISEVRLSNGNVLIARTVTLVGDTYDISVLPSGVTALARRKVAGVDSLPREAFLRRKWEEISANVGRMKSPIDLYVKGVTRCFRWGMEEEGYELLETLLAMPNSAQVPAIFVQEVEVDAARLWEQASGRAPLDPLPGVTIAATAPPRPASESPGPAVGPAMVAPGDLQAIKAALGDVRRLTLEAQVIYKRVITTSGDLGELHAAREKLETAAAILGRLPPDAPEVRTVKRQTAELLHAVVKSLPF